LGTYESDRARSYKILVEGPAAEVDAFSWGTSKDLDVADDSKSSSMRFLFPRFSAPLELIEGRDEVGDPVLSEP
jgi:hypothetical protein